MYQGFCWHLGAAGDTCDETCANFNAANEALGASNVISSGDCSIMEHFNNDLGLQLSGNMGASTWGFGYMFTFSTTRFCSAYSSTKIGANVGEQNTNIDRRLVCACTGNHIQSYKRNAQIFSFLPSKLNA